MKPKPHSDILKLSGISDLSEDASLDEVEAALVKMGELAREQKPSLLRLKMLGIGAFQILKGIEVPQPKSLVDIALAERTIHFPKIEPWHEPIDGQRLLKDIIETFKRFVVFPAQADIAVALWTMWTYVFAAARYSPFLALTSPTKRCAKSQVLDVLDCLAFRSQPTGNLTKAVLFRTISKYQPTLLIDEADTFLEGDDAMRGILNCSHRKTGAYVLRCEGDSYEPQKFSVWSPKAIAKIGKFPGTLEDRSIQISMQRMFRHEKVERLNIDRLREEVGDLRRKLVRWSTDNLPQLMNAKPALPKDLHDRQADNWELLLGIADVIGGPWPGRAREAASVLSGQVADDDVNVRLLSDIRAYLLSRNSASVDRVKSEDLITHLTTELEGAPWLEWKGRPLTQHGLSVLLDAFGIKPYMIRFPDKSLRGYWINAFLEPFARYLEPMPNARDEPKDEPKQSVGSNHEMQREFSRWQSEQLREDDTADREYPDQDGQL